MYFFALFAFSQTASAQEYVYGVSHVEQVGDPADPGSVMAGYSGTGMTYGLATWYNAVQVSTLERDGAIVGQQIYENFPSVFNVTAAPLLAGSVYRQYTDSILRIIYNNICGAGWYNAFGFSSGDNLPYGENNLWYPFPIPPVCVANQLIYLGYTVAEEQASQPNQPCVDTCVPCKRDKRNKEIICGAGASECEAQAYLAYQSALSTCSDQGFCDPSSPTFNQQQCDTCRADARNAFIDATAACPVSSNCFLSVPDCFGKVSCPNGPI
jgi:hypothetical protein